MIKEQMKQNILDYIKERGNGVTFVELETIPGVKGDFAYDGKGNIVFWEYVSKIFISSIRELINEDRIKPRNTNILTYMLDGECLNYPIAKSIRAYKKLRWLPLVFDLIEQTA